MAKIVIEVPDELAAVGEAMVETLEAVRSTLATAAADGRAVDYGRIESDVAAKTASIERASHRSILAGLDIDLPAVLIGGVRYTRVGRCEGPYHTLAGSVSVERSLYRRSGARGGQPEARTVDAVSLRAGVVGDGW